MIAGDFQFIALENPAFAVNRISAAATGSTRFRPYKTGYLSHFVLFCN